MPEPKLTKPSILKVDLNNVVLQAWAWFKCPSCKKEWSHIQTLEIVTEDGTALIKLPAHYKQHGYDASSLPQVLDPKLATNPKGILSKLLSEGAGRVTHLPEQGKGNSVSVPQMQSKKRNVGIISGVPK